MTYLTYTDDDYKLRPFFNANNISSGMQANFEASLHVLMFFICFLFLFYATPFTLLYAPLCDELDRTPTEFLLTTALLISRKTTKSNMKLGLNTCKTRIYNTKYRITGKGKQYHTITYK